MFCAVWNRFNASTEVGPQDPVTASGARYPLSTSACWISLYRSGVGTAWRVRHVLRTGALLPRRAAAVVPDFPEAVLAPEPLAWEAGVWVPVFLAVTV